MSPGTSSCGDDHGHLAAAAHARVRRCHLLQRVERGLGAALLVEAEDRVEDDDEQDGDGVAEAREEALLAVGREPDDDRDGRRREQRQDERVGELVEEPRDGALARRLGQAILPVASESRSHFFVRQPLRGSTPSRSSSALDLFGVRRLFRPSGG